MSFKGLKILSLMQRWGSKREMMGDDPPYLAVGTEVSAKYKGAFCEAKVRKIVRSVKCKIAYKLGLGTAVVTDDQIKGTLRAGSVVEVRHADKKEYVEATIIKIQDCSQYTVVFDDGDITTLRRTALCLKSGRHFAESETLDQLPLTHPEHFGNPVIGGRRGRRNRHDDSSDDEESSKKGKQPKEEKEADIGKVVCVEISEKKKQKDNWFPGLVVAPTAQDTVKINVKEDYLVRSFKDGRYYTVPKKEATPFTREIGQKVDNNTLRAAVEKALLFLDRDELPPHWDRELLFGLTEITDTDSDAAFDSDTSDDEPREEKDHFVAQLYKFMDDRGTPINKGPTINGRDVDLYKLFKVVHKLGGCT
uniref:ARID domain-containing protein n=1 Tax=Homalodisca liturata TaxID=320908 RepID=A0A1B6HE02_9HEMI